MSNPFFIVGVPRSGTTLLTVLLNNHSEVFLDKKAIAIRTLNFQQRVELAIKKTPSVERQNIWRAEAAKDDRLQSFLHWPLLDAKDITLGDFVSRSFAQRAKIHNKTLFGDKSPDAIERLPELLSLFPEAKLVIVVRDARPNVASLVKRQYLHLRVAAQRWKDWNAAGTAAAEWLGANRVLHVRYEDLLTKPETTLLQVCSFLSIAFEPGMLDLENAAATQQKDAYVKKTLDTAAIDKWKKELSPTDVAKIEYICGDWMHRFNYETITPTAGNQDLGFWTDYRLRIANSFRLIFRPNRKEMKDQRLVEVRVPLTKRLYIFAATIAGGIFRKDLLESSL